MNPFVELHQEQITAGRAHLAGSPLVEAFLRLLEVARGRCTADDVLDLLDAPPILARQDFTQPDITVIRRWVREAGIRWGGRCQTSSRIGPSRFSR